MTAASGGAPEAFGSTLSVAEFALLAEAGITPISVVTGCEMSWLTVTPPMPAQPPKRAAWSGSAPERYSGDVVAVRTLDTAMAEARGRALAQLRNEAGAAGANAVIGVRRVFTGMPAPPVTQAVGGFLRHHNLVPAPVTVNQQVEYQLVGTAVRDPAITGPGIHETTVSGAQYATLRRAGWEPAGIVGGCSHQFGTNTVAGFAEAVGATGIWEAARASAQDLLRTEIDAIGADGAIDLQLSTRHATIELPEKYRENVYKATGAGLGVAVLVTVEMLAAAIRRAAAATPSLPPNQMIILR